MACDEVVNCNHAWLLRCCFHVYSLRLDVNKARSGQGQNCIDFFQQILHFDPIFSKNRNFRSIFDGTSKILAQNAFGRRLLLLCLHMNRKCHILAINVTKHFNSNSKTTRPRGQAGQGLNIPARKLRCICTCSPLSAKSAVYLLYHLVLGTCCQLAALLMDTLKAGLLIKDG